MRGLKRFGASQERAFGAKYTRYGNGRFAFQTQAVERLPDQRSILHTGLLLRLHTLYIEQPFVTLGPNEEYNPSSSQSNEILSYIWLILAHIYHKGFHVCHVSTFFCCCKAAEDLSLSFIMIAFKGCSGYPFFAPSAIFHNQSFQNILPSHGWVGFFSAPKDIVPGTCVTAKSWTALFPRRGRNNRP